MSGCPTNRVRRIAARGQRGVLAALKPLPRSLAHSELPSNHLRRAAPVQTDEEGETWDEAVPPRLAAAPTRCGRERRPAQRFDA